MVYSHVGSLDLFLILGCTDEIQLLMWLGLWGYSQGFLVAPNSDPISD